MCLQKKNNGGSETMSSSKNLFSPIHMGAMKLKNRIVLAPMATHYGTEKGRMTERQIQYYLERAKGGVGLIVTESNYVSLEGRGGINRLGLYDDHQIQEHKQLTGALHKVGTPVCAQLHHGGVTVSMKAVGQYPVSCSAVPNLTRGELFVGNIPRRLSESEIEGLVQSFSKAAWRAKESGFDAVMVHGAHGYLINEFLSPHTNKREDRYGASEENRARFLMEIVESIRKKLGPNFPVMVRLTGEELFDGGYRIDFIKKVAKWLEDAGTDEINISAGNYEEIERMVAPPVFPEGFLSKNSAAIKEVVRIPVGVVGRIMSPSTAERIIAGGEADLVYLGRALIADPEFPKKAEEGKENEIRPCIVCNKGCIDRLFEGVDIGCSVNAAMGKEASRKISPTGRPKKVLIVGGGPAGLEAARVAAARGHHVTLCEKSKTLGGTLNQAVLLPNKEPISRLIQYQIKQIEILGVTVELEKEVTPAMIRKSRPDVLVMAVGAEPIRLGLPGANLPHVFVAEDFLKGKVSLGSSTIIIGGGLFGAELAEAIVDQGREVIMIEQLDSIGSQAGFIIKKEQLKRLCHKGVKMLVHTKAIAITGQGVLVERFGEKETIRADTIILAIGYHPREDLLQKLDIDKIEFYQIGDCVQPHTIMEAIEEGNRVGFMI
jgi:2,4-dienoyl-CoA reductase-like NADH-dependent reductase (Old Yellow Enzyme family)/thioredoxin reductase